MLSPEKKAGVDGWREVCDGFWRQQFGDGLLESWNKHVIWVNIVNTVTSLPLAKWVMVEKVRFLEWASGAHWCDS